MIALVLLVWLAGIVLGVQLGRAWYRNADRERVFLHEVRYWQSLADADPPVQYDWAKEPGL